MLSSDDYFDFECAVEEILEECFVGTNPDPKPSKSSLIVDGYTKLTSGNKYFFTGDLSKYREQLVSICEALPRYPAVIPESCSTISYADLLPDDMTTKRELLKSCNLADAFFALLEINEIGVADDAFKSKYGFQISIINGQYQDRLKPNRSAFASEEDLEPNI